MYLKDNTLRHPGQIPDVSETLLKSVFIWQGERKSTTLKIEDASIFTVTFLTNSLIIGFDPESLILVDLHVFYMYKKISVPRYVPRFQDHNIDFVLDPWTSLIALYSIQDTPRVFPYTCVNTYMYVCVKKICQRNSHIVNTTCVLKIFCTRLQIAANTKKIR